MITQPRAGEREASKLAGRVKGRRCVRRDTLAGVHFASRATQYPGNRQSAGKPNRW